MRIREERVAPASGGRIRSTMLAYLGLTKPRVIELLLVTTIPAMLLANRYDALLLDLGLPDGDGQQLLRDMRRRRDPTPVVVLSARGHRNDRIDLLDVGADDYLVKPIDLGELEARLRAVTRRRREVEGGAAPLVHGALRLDRGSGTVVWRDRRLALRDRERNLLELFLRHPDRTFTRAQIEAELYGSERSLDSNAVEVYVHYLRRKITSDLIVTVRGQGYRLGPPPSETTP